MLVPPRPLRDYTVDSDEDAGAVRTCAFVAATSYSALDLPLKTVPPGLPATFRGRRRAGRPSVEGEPAPEWPSLGYHFARAGAPAAGRRSATRCHGWAYLVAQGRIELPTP